MTLLLAPELTDVCDAGGGCASGLVAVAVFCAGDTGEVFEVDEAVGIFWIEAAGPRWRLDVLDGARGSVVLVASDAERNVSLSYRGKGQAPVPCSCGASREAFCVKKSLMLRFRDLGLAMLAIEIVGLW
jgi:hypothetical protein